MIGAPFPASFRGAPDSLAFIRLVSSVPPPAAPPARQLAYKGGHEGVR